MTRYPKPRKPRKPLAVLAAFVKHASGTFCPTCKRMLAELRALIPKEDSRG